MLMRFMDVGGLGADGDGYAVVHMDLVSILDGCGHLKGANGG